MRHCSDDERILDLFTKVSHHCDVACIYLTLNLFPPGKFSRNISLNAHYIIAFNHPRDTLGLRTLAQQEQNINGYQHCIYDRVVPEYKVCEGGKPLKCKHMDTPTLRVSRSVNNPFRPYFICRRKEMCKYFQWADEIPVDTYYEREPPVYNPEETAKLEIIQRPKLMRQFARTDNVTDCV